MSKQLSIAHLPEDHFLLKIPSIVEKLERCKASGEQAFTVIETEDGETTGKLSLYTVYEGALSHVITLKTNLNKITIGAPCYLENLARSIASAERYGV